MSFLVSRVVRSGNEKSYTGEGILRRASPIGSPLFHDSSRKSQFWLAYQERHLSKRCRCGRDTGSEYGVWAALAGALSEETGLSPKGRFRSVSLCAIHSVTARLRSKSSASRSCCTSGSRLSLPQVEDIFHERGIDISYEAVRAWRNSFGPLFAAEIRKKRSAMADGSPQ
jgi:hypothetical protein